MIRDLLPGTVFCIPVDLNPDHATVVSVKDASHSMATAKDALFIVKIKANSGPFANTEGELLISGDALVDLIKKPKPQHSPFLTRFSPAWWMIVAVVATTVYSASYDIGVLSGAIFR